jgi:hypothetical protein
MTKSLGPGNNDKGNEKLQPRKCTETYYPEMYLETITKIRKYNVGQRSTVSKTETKPGTSRTQA